MDSVSAACPISAIGCVRVSTENQARAQREKIQLYCQLHDRALVDLISDEGMQIIPTCPTPKLITN